MPSIHLTPEELETVQTALRWYVDDRYECAKYAFGDALRQDELGAAEKAEMLLEKLEAQLS